MEGNDEKREQLKPDAQWEFVFIFGILGILLGSYAYIYSGWQFSLLFILGSLIGFTLFHARFGFSAVYRHIVESGNTEMLRAHMVMLGTASLLFAPIFAFDVGLFGQAPQPALAPASFGVVVGAFLFGFGMEIGSGLAPSSLYRAEGGRTASIFTLAGFFLGSFAGAYHYTFWHDVLPAPPEFSLATDTVLGYGGSVFLQLLLFVGIGVGTYMYKLQKRPPALPPLPSVAGWRRMMFGSWPLWTGAALLGVLNAAVLMVQGSPWKLTAAFTFWSSSLAETLGIDAAGWAYWGSQDSWIALDRSVFMHDLSVLNFGVITGTLLTLALGGLIRFGPVPPRVIAAALGGGLLMGYGATISFGANIGAYFSAIASFSLHAWVWTFMAVIGVYSAFFLAKKLNLPRAGSKGKG
ncbi:hypothetical protein B0H94_12124 [Salsuginibacillus halophilus]|uniref:Uncharacterized protein n=1 Tax=Salsuginibacillus halophilus TaxID=517424 RepID=A0A2P8H3T1_9BACI|nr:YeeE/YedE family protein [Salsuginibacillus halophilus]PSL40859.1 hypothetical protein B0H94_12124 [Salsuginibacillus halophilus]